MAGLGEVASIIAVLQLSSKVIDYVGKAKDASEDRKRLRSEVRACQVILQQIKYEIGRSHEVPSVCGLQRFPPFSSSLMRLMNVRCLTDVVADFCIRFLACKAHQ
jgi:hypothetical protein